MMRKEEEKKECCKDDKFITKVQSIMADEETIFLVTVPE